MGVHVTRFEQDGDVRWGVVFGDRIAPLPDRYETLAEFLEKGAATARGATESTDTICAKDVRMLSPVTAPCSIICQGLNYRDHLIETGGTGEKPPFNLLFVKAESSLSGPYDDVIRPPGVRLLDYELELGIVVGAHITNATTITDGNLADYVAGIVITNDVSARDVQIPQEQWFKGKSFRTFCPTGPYLYLLDNEDVPRLKNIDIELSVNGKSRQKSNTSNLLYGPAETLTELSGLMDLKPGDLIQTGTPGGVAVSAPPKIVQRLLRLVLGDEKLFKLFVKKQLRNPNYLKDGDVMTLTMKSKDETIDLGVMETRVAAGNGGTQL